MNCSIRSKFIIAVEMCSLLTFHRRRSVKRMYVSEEACATRATCELGRGASTMLGH